jgi:hypothetical protein
MARTTTTSGIAGPFGLRISSGSLTRFTTPTNVIVKPFYLDSAGAKISNGKAKATAFNLYLGGVLSGLSVLEQKVASADVVWAFDSAPIDNKLDSFFLNAATINLPSITALGVVAENVTIKLKDLSNNPELLKLKGLAAGSWLGSITLSGSKVSFPATPNLTLTPKAMGGDALSAIYDLPTGDLALSLSNVDYTTPQISVVLQDSTMTLRNSTRNLNLSGKVDLSLPTLGLTKVNGNLESFSIVNSAVETLKVSLNSAMPIGALGLSGMFSIDQNLTTNTGTFSVTSGVIAGISVTGNLSYTNSGDPAVDSITGKLNFDNRSARNDLSLDALGLTLVPLSGQLDYVYRPLGSASPGTTLTFSDVNFDLIIGAVTTSFSGNMTMKIDTNSDFSLDQLELTLLNPPAKISIPDVGHFMLEAANPEEPVKFSLQRYKQADGLPSDLVPVLSGKLSFSSTDGNSYASIGGLAYMPIPDTDPLVSAWTILDANATISFN